MIKDLLVVPMDDGEFDLIITMLSIIVLVETLLLVIILDMWQDRKNAIILGIFFFATMLHTFGKFFVYTPQIALSFFGGEMFAFAGWFPYNTCFALFLRNQIKILYGSIKLHRFVDLFLCLVIIAGLISSACFAAYCIDRQYTEEYVISISIYLPVQVAFEEIVNILTLYRCLKLKDKSGLRVSMVVMVFCLAVDIAFLIPDFFDPDQTWFILRPFTYQFKGLLEVIVFNHLRKLVAIRSLYDNVANNRISRNSTIFLKH